MAETVYRGRITDVNGDPIKGASVVIFTQGNTQRELGVIPADNDGWYEIPLQPPLLFTTVDLQFVLVGGIPIEGINEDGTPKCWLRNVSLW
jgi:hypothetical protein